MSKRQVFVANRGGHAPGHLRDAFLDCFDRAGFDTQPWYETLAGEEVISFNDRVMQERWEAMTAEERGLWLTGQFWNCTDTIPRDICSNSLDLPRGSTYAMAARNLRSQMK